MSLKRFNNMNEDNGKNEFKRFQNFMGNALSGEKITFDNKQKDKSVADIADFKEEVIYIVNIEDYDNTDILTSIGELVNMYHLTTSDVQKVLEEETEFEFQKYLGIIYDEMVKEDGITAKYDKNIIKWFDENDIIDYEKAMVSLEKHGLTITKK